MSLVFSDAHRARIIHRGGGATVDGVWNKHTSIGLDFSLTLNPDGSLREHRLRDSSDSWGGCWSQISGDRVELVIGKYRCILSEIRPGTWEGPETASDSPNGIVTLTNRRPHLGNQLLPSDQRIDVFVSHSGIDKELASSFVNLLRSSLGMLPEAIRCTSADGTRLQGGAHVDDALRSHIKSARLMIALLTPNSLSSPYVLMELGARWIIEKKLVPVLARGADASMLRGPLMDLNPLRGTERASLEQLLEEASQDLGLQKVSASAYDSHLEHFQAQAKSAQ